MQSTAILEACMRSLGPPSGSIAALSPAHRQVTNRSSPNDSEPSRSTAIPHGTANTFRPICSNAFKIGFQYHGDELYTELKHVRNALDQVLASAHQLLHAKLARSATPDDDGQLSLF